MLQQPRAILVLADGTVFQGISIGIKGITVGEVAFNTAMTGYQEILTDPSYCQQIITLTYPHIGNTGSNKEDIESAGSVKVFAAGLVIRDLSLTASNWRKTESLPTFLENHNVVAIAGIDTRKLTRILREKGAQAGCIMAGDINIEAALQRAQTFPGLVGMDLAKVVSCQHAYQWTESDWRLGYGYASQPTIDYRIAALDFGVKQTILRRLASRNCSVTVYPAQTPVEEILLSNPDGVFLSNGPGDPEPCDFAIDTVRRLIDMKIPIFGICLGHQILALAAGAKTMKMKFGHHGANHPVLDIDSGKVIITSQNHGFAVDMNQLPTNIRVTHLSLFDKSLQGFELINSPAFCFQGHPEASPGPHDASYLFDRFIDRIKQYKKQQSHVAK